MASLVGIRLLSKKAGVLRNSIIKVNLPAPIVKLQHDRKCFHSRIQNSTSLLSQGEVQNIRYFSDTTSVAQERNNKIEKRIIALLTKYDRISDPTKINLDAHFMNDLGLDSLDHVEVIMAIEDEFGFEIPDMDAERLNTVGELVRYVADREDVYE